MQIPDFIKSEAVNWGIVVAAGMIFAAVYDLFRIARRVIVHNAVATAVEDLIYWFVLTLVVFVIVLRINQGNYRFYFILGSAFGAALYEVLIGRFLVPLAAKILGKLLRFIRSLLKKAQKLFKMKNRGDAIARAQRTRK